jgi:hypothetical protein
MAVAAALEKEGDAQEAKAGNRRLTTELKHQGRNTQKPAIDRNHLCLFFRARVPRRFRHRSAQWAGDPSFLTPDAPSCGT